MKRVHLFMALVLTGRVFTFPFLLIILLLCGMVSAAADSLRWCIEWASDTWYVAVNHFRSHIKAWHNLTTDPQWIGRKYLLAASEESSWWDFFCDAARASWGY